MPLPDANPIGLGSSTLWKYIRSPLGGKIASTIIFAIVLIFLLFAPVSSWLKDSGVIAFIIWMFLLFRYISVHTPKDDGGMIFTEDGYMFKRIVDALYGTKDHILSRDDVLASPDHSAFSSLNAPTQPDALPPGRPLS